MAYNRYSKFTKDGTIELVPFIKIDKMPTDYYVYFDSNIMRMDTLSYDYYGDANYGWLILQANPEVGSLEYQIPDNTLLRIPYPLDAAITNYNNGIKRYKELYGSN